MSYIKYHKDFIKFVLFGALAATINLIARIPAGYYFNFSLSVALSYSLGMIVAFILYKNFVFQKTNKKSFWQGISFFSINLLGLALNVIVSNTAKPILQNHIHSMFFCEEVAHLLGIVSVTFSSYLGNKYWVFR